MDETDQNLASGILTIDLSAIVKNYQSIQNYCLSLDAKALLSAVVKANGYGLGMLEVCHALYGAGCRLFFVATPDEGIELRAQHADIEIFILDGLFLGAENTYREFELIPCLATAQQIKAWVEFTDLPCVVHFNTGINRLGMSLVEFRAIPSAVTDRLNIHHIMSHFASADLPEDVQNTEQVAQFELISDHLPNQLRSFGNSAAIALKQLHDIKGQNTNILRPGVALWGVKPFADYPIELEPVVRLDARVLQISSLNAGDKVGYVHLFTADKPLITAIVAVGYADGLLRQMSSSSTNNGYFSFAGEKLPIIGKVSMDMIVVDISLLADGAIVEGDFVEVIGKNINLDMLAQWSDTIAYEVLTSLGNRYLRNYVNGES